MTNDVVSEWIHREPFVPFRIHTTNGRTFDVMHPEFAMLLRTTLVLGNPETDGVSMVSLIHVNEFESLGEPVETSAAGS